MTLLTEARVTRCATLVALLAFPSAAFAQRTAAAPSSTPGSSEPAAGPPDKKLSGLSATTLPAPTPPGSLVTLSFEDANLDEVVHAMSVMTGRRFVVAATPKSFVANVVAPQKVTVEEAYQALLSVLLANHLTVVPSGPFSKIVDTGEAAHEAPLGGRDVPLEDRYLTYIHKVRHLRAEEVASTVLSKLASHDAQVLAFGNTLILTDTGTNIRRMMKVLDELDVAGAEDKLWLEPLKYAISGDVKKEIDELLDLKNTKDKDPRRELKGSPRVTRIVALERPNAILIVGTHEGYVRLLELLQQIDVAQPSAGQMHVIMLAHAEAKKLVTALTDAVTQATSPQAGGSAGGLASQKQPLGIFDAPVKVSAEETNNALIVTASAHDFAAISDVIRRLDQPRRQVYIEAVVMDLSVDNSTQVGAAFNAFGNLQSQLGPGAVAYGGFNPLNSIALPTDTTTLQGLVLGLRGPSIPVPGFLQSALGTSSIPGIGFLIDASTVSQDSDVVQTPSVMTTDNMPAEFHMQLNTSLQKNAASIALPPAAGAAGAGAAAAYTPYSAPAQQNYGKIGPMLQVTPHLNESDDVRLDVEETISDLTPDPPQGTLGTVNFIERHAMTTMTVKDGSTAIIGGLVRNTVQHASTKVPILGDIPLIGFFFRSSADVVSKANLVLVLTPHIIRDEEDMRKVVTKRMEERQEFLDHYLLFHQDTGAPIGFDPKRGSGLLRMIDQDFKKTDEERQIALDGAAHAPALHEERPPIELPSAPASETKEPAAGQGAPGAAPAATHGGVTRVE